MIHVFGDFELDTDRGELRRAGQARAVEPQVLGVLACLVGSPGRIVTRDELLARVWGHGYVSDATVTSRVRAARRAIGDDGRSQAMIRTVRGQGYRFVPPRTEPAGPDLAATGVPLERDAESAALDRLLAEAAAGTRRMAIVTGEPGQGKTTLVESFAARAAAGAAVGVGRCPEPRGPVEAYLPVLEAVVMLAGDDRRGSAVVRTLADRAPTWLLQVPWLADAATLAGARERAVGAGPERMLREMVHAIESLAGPSPVLIVLDDLQWADETTIALLDHLIRRREPARLMILGASRPAPDRPVDSMRRGLVPRGRCQEIRLSLLSPAGVATMLARRWPGVGPDDALTTQVHRSTGGNPLFVTCLADAIPAGATAEQALSHLALGVPATVVDLVQQEVADLEPADLALVEAGSVSGGTFSAAAAGAGVGVPDDEAERRLAALASHRRLLRPAGEASWPDGTVAGAFAFVHDVHRQAVYATLPAARRRGLHRRLAARLESALGDEARMHAAELAGHHLAAGDAAAAVRFLRLAAETALARGAPATAVRDLRSALELLPRLPGGADATAELPLQAMLGSALVMSEGYASPGAERAFRRAADLATAGDTPGLAATFLHAVAGLHEYRGEYGASEAMAARAAEFAAAAGTEAQLVEAHELIACSLFHQGRHREALEHAETALSHYRSGDDHPLVRLHGEDPGVASRLWAALARWCMGDAAGADGDASRALEMASEPGRLHSLAAANAQSARLAAMRGDPEQAGPAAARALDLAEEHGFVYQRAMGAILLGWSRALTGDAAGGVELMHEGLATHRDLGAYVDRPFYLALFAEALRRAGRVDEARAAVDEGLGMTAEGRRFYYEPELLRLRGELTLEPPAADPAAAVSDLHQAIDSARRLEAPPLELRAALSLARVAPDDDAGLGAVRDALTRCSAGDAGRDAAAARDLLGGGA